MSNKIKVTLEYRKYYPYDRAQGSGPLHQYQITKITGSPTVQLPGEPAATTHRVGDTLSEEQANALACKHEVTTTTCKD